MEILFIVTNVSTPTAIESGFKTLLEGVPFLHTVTYHEDNTAPPVGFEADYDLLIQSPSAAQNGQWAFYDADLPLIVFRNSELAGYELVSALGSTLTAQDSTYFISGNHAILTTLGWGTSQRVLASTTAVPFDSGDNMPGDAVLVGTVSVGDTTPVMWTLDIGDSLDDSTVLTKRRIAAPLMGSMMGIANSDWNDLLVAMIEWLTGSPPATPVVTIDGFTATSVDASTSAFIAGELGATHALTGWSVYRAGDDVRVAGPFQSVLDKLATTALGSLVPSLAHYVGAIHQDDAGRSSAEGFSADFTTLALDDGTINGTISASDPDWEKIWLIDPEVWTNYSDFSSLQGRLVASLDGDMRAPHAFVPKDSFVTHSDEVRVSVLCGFDSFEGLVGGGILGFRWAWYWTIENSGVGAVALANGFYVGQGTPLMNGIFAAIHIGFIWPYGDCSNIGQGTSWTTGSSKFQVEVWEDGVRTRVASVFPIDLNPGQLQIETRVRTNVGCPGGKIPFYGVMLKVTKDRVGDPDGCRFLVEAKFQPDTLPTDDATWDVSFTHDAVGSLNCGAAGFGAFLAPNATGTDPSGGLYFEKLLVENISEGCDDCDPLIPPTPTIGEPTITVDANCASLTACIEDIVGTGLVPPIEARFLIYLG